MIVEVSVAGAAQLARTLTRVAARADRRTAAVVAKHTALLAARVRQHASGSPGPEVITGGYVGSITAQLLQRERAHVGVVGTAHPAGQRNEFGMVGVDAAGRHVDQPPRPHFWPALMETVPGFLVDMAAVAALDR